MLSVLVVCWCLFVCVPLFVLCVRCVVYGLCMCVFVVECCCGVCVCVYMFGIVFGVCPPVCVLVVCVACVVVCACGWFSVVWRVRVCLYCGLVFLFSFLFRARCLVSFWI